MATVSEVTLTCDICGEVTDVKTRTFGLDGKTYEIDLCRKDGNALDKVTARYIAKAQKVAAAGGARARAAPAKKGKAGGAPAQAATARQQEGVYVYGILPADIEMTGDMPGVGEHPGPLRVVRLDGLAALISDVHVSGRLGSAGDRQNYQEILDATAVEVPVLPLRFGTVLASEDAVAEELLAARHDEFTAALERLEGRAEFQVKGRYVKDAVTADREQDTQALRQTMDRLCVASATREPAGELDAVDIAFLVTLTDEDKVEQVIEDLAREWEGRIELRLLGPMAAYDFAETPLPDA